ncbi:hypothetical protein BHM03_00033320 [Ensete ventricosum]|nr:hypothetical protein BHM03_00033320 [Ensete ventricosum]
MKYVLVTGGVVSGLGKGVTASSIGVLLKACGLRVTAIKIGDIESMPFIEALGPGNFCLVHVSLVPVLDAVGEQVRIAMVGKYTGLSDSYISVLKVNACITH